MRSFVSKARLESRSLVGWKLLAGAVSVAGVAAACGSAPSSSTSSVAPTEKDAGVQVPVSDAGTMGTFVAPDDGGSGSTEIAMALEFVPSQATLTVDGTNPQTATFQLKATMLDGTVEMVSPTSTEFDRPDIASATLGAPVSVTASGAYGGTGTLHAIFGGREAVATLHVIVAQRSLGTVTADVATALDNAGSTPSDTAVTAIQYPYDKTVFPLGLTAPVVMWTAPTGGSHANDVYRLHLQESSYSYDVYATTPLQTTSPTAAAAQWNIDQSVWDRVTASNAGTDDPLQVVLSRYDVELSTAAASATMSWTIAPASLRGAIYYWTASKSTLSDGGVTQTGHITRMAPGTGASPVELNSGRCMGCHAVSADGTTLVAAIDDPATAPAVSPYILSWQNPPTRPWAAFDVSGSTPAAGYQSTEYGADIALTPDGQYTVWGAPTNVLGSKVLSLSNTKTGALVTSSGLDGLLVALGGDVLSMPAFSPDGTMLAAVRSPSSSDNVLPNNPKAIVFLNYTAGTQTFGSSITSIASATDSALATGETALAYPSFTPDNQYVAFHAGTKATGCQGSVANHGCDDTTADDGQLYLAPVSGGGAVRLSAINDPPSASDRNASVEPTFDPLAAGGYSWVVFTSMRAWGNMGWPVAPGEDVGQNENFKRRLWVAAIDQKVGTVDPSHPPFYLAGQDDTPNMRGFWANAQCTKTAAASETAGACTQGFECCSGFCKNGMCVDPSTLACRPIGAGCDASGECCNGTGGVSCTNGTCQVDMPK
jgi:hypothetical protein